LRAIDPELACIVCGQLRQIKAFGHERQLDRPTDALPIGRGGDAFLIGRFPQIG
jgi:hypothetical protein